MSFYFGLKKGLSIYIFFRKCYNFIVKVDVYGKEKEEERERKI
jgi:hypothetical protein